MQTFSNQQLASADIASLHAESDGLPAFCELSSAADDISARRAVGHVEKAAYYAPIRFYDPLAATSKNLTAPGLLVRARTHIAVHNTTGKPITLRAILREATLNDPKVSTSLPELLLPHGTIGIRAAALFDELALEHVDTATLTLETDASPGAVVAALTQDDSGLNEDIPLRTPNPKKFSAGAYPLRWEQDYSNLVSVTNTSDRVLKARALITAGSVTYTLPIETIPSGRTSYMRWMLLEENA